MLGLIFIDWIYTVAADQSYRSSIKKKNLYVDLFSIHANCKKPWPCLCFFHDCDKIIQVIAVLNQGFHELCILNTLEWLVKHASQRWDEMSSIQEPLQISVQVCFRKALNIHHKASIRAGRCFLLMFCVKLGARGRCGSYSSLNNREIFSDDLVGQYSQPSVVYKTIDSFSYPVKVESACFEFCPNMSMLPNFFL